MTIFFKSTRLDGRDFYTGSVDYAAALTSGEPLPALSGQGPFPGMGWYHLATVPTECVGMQWPCRLFEVEPVGDVMMRNAHPHKIGARSVRVLREIEAHRVFGPQGEQVVALIECCRTLSAAELDRLYTAGYAARDAAGDAAWAAAEFDRLYTAGYAAWAAAGDAAWAAAELDRLYTAGYAAWAAARDAAGDTAGYAAWYAARDAARDAAWAAAWAAVRGLLLRDLIGQHPGWDQAAYDALTGPWRRTIGPIHPDDAPMSDYLRGRIDKQERIRNVMAGER